MVKTNLKLHTIEELRKKQLNSTKTQIIIIKTDIKSDLKPFQRWFQLKTSHLHINKSIK